ncbi:MAG TPA: hypothetical protein VFU43_03715 [Streptosporangiaceae bacterium]|nr:hypothetical protein [Streptosporangiaceae bacterium]
MVSTSDSFVQSSPADVAVSPPRPSASYGADLVTVLLGVWFTAGLMLDAWAHNNKPELETFFTPWHAVFYSGFAATAGWIAWTSRGALRSGPRAIPTGYAPALVAVAGFAVAGFGDFVWHTAFGIEQSIDILFSPTHLGLATTMLVIVTAPLRSALGDRSLPPAPGLVRLLPAILPMALGAALVLLFLQYANAFDFDSERIVAALSTVDESLTARWVSAMAVTNLVLIVPVLTLARRWRPPFGAITIIYTFVAGLCGAITNFESPELIIGLVAAGGCADLLAGWLRPTPERLTQFRAFAALTPLVTWSIYIAAAYLAAPPAESATGFAGSHPEALIEIYTGAPIVQALIGLLVAMLLVPRQQARTP